MAVTQVEQKKHTTKFELSHGKMFLFFITCTINEGKFKATYFIQISHRWNLYNKIIKQVLITLFMINDS